MTASVLPHARKFADKPYTSATEISFHWGSDAVTLCYRQQPRTGRRGGKRETRHSERVTCNPESVAGWVSSWPIIWKESPRRWPFFPVAPLPRPRLRCAELRSNAIFRSADRPACIGAPLGRREPTNRRRTSSTQEKSTKYPKKPNVCGSPEPRSCGKGHAMRAKCRITPSMAEWSRRWISPRESCLAR